MRVRVRVRLRVHVWPFGARAADAYVGVFGGLESFEGSSSCWLLLFSVCLLV